MYAMGKKPDWVPVRIWSLWLEHRDTNDLWQPCLDAPDDIHPRPETGKAIHDLGCKCVWKALDRRFDENTVRQIFDDIQEATLGANDSHAETPHAIRSRLGGRAARLSLSLRGVIEEIADARTEERSAWGTDMLPLEISEPLNQVIRELVNCRSGDRHMSPEDYFALSSIAENIAVVLEALRVGATSWASSHPAVTQKGGDPARVYFVRKMTKVFRESFKTPLRAQVAALTRCLYPGDMTESNVARLAP